MHQGHHFKILQLTPTPQVLISQIYKTTISPIMDKLIVTATLLSIFLIFTTIVITGRNASSSQSPSLGTSIINTEGKQIVELTAKGGYSPASVNAEAGKDTVLRIKTNNTFDCSAALVIPSLKISRMLPATGTTDIALGVQSAGSKVEGTCSMGMYRFSINF